MLTWPGKCSQGIGGYGNPTADRIGTQTCTAEGPTMTALEKTSGMAVVTMLAAGSAGTLTTSIAVNGRRAVSESIPGSWATYGDLIRIGAVGEGSYALDGDLGELIVFDTALTPTEQRVVEEYLARKWDRQITPAAPSGVVVTPVGGGTVDLSWSESGWDGGAAVTGYTAVASPSGLMCSSAPGAGGCHIGGLVPGVEQTITVVAGNGIGNGPASRPVAVLP